MATNMTPSQAKQHQWNNDYYGSAVGGTIVGIEQKPDEYGQDLWVTLLVRNGDHLMELEISSDTEGNQPGFLFGCALPEPAGK